MLNLATSLISTPTSALKEVADVLSKLTSVATLKSVLGDLQKTVSSLVSTLTESLGVGKKKKAKKEE